MDLLHFNQLAVIKPNRGIDLRTPDAIDRRNRAIGILSGLYLFRQSRGEFSNGALIFEGLYSASRAAPEAPDRYFLDPENGRHYCSHDPITWDPEEFDVHVHYAATISFSPGAQVDFFLDVMQPSLTRYVMTSLATSYAYYRIMCNSGAFAINVVNQPIYFLAIKK